MRLDWWITLTSYWRYGQGDLFICVWTGSAHVQGRQGFYGVLRQVHHKVAPHFSKHIPGKLNFPRAKAKARAGFNPHRSQPATFIETHIRNRADVRDVE
jgi:hypothetical protein